MPEAQPGDPSLFALLEDGGAQIHESRSRCYTDHVRTWVCEDPAALNACWERVEADQRAGLHALVLADYEWGAALQGVPPPPGWASGALRVLMFRRLAVLDPAGVDAWLAAREGTDAPEPAGVLDARPSVDGAGFQKALARIQEHLCAGDTYQVNYTLRLDLRTFGSPVALYRRLRRAQPVAFAAFIHLGGGRHALSLSPELFLRHEPMGPTGRLIARPMKGTAPRGREAAEDERLRRTLSADPKVRAENIMIVDLLRNDLGRVARPGSVRVQDLFQVEAHPTLFQLTSTVVADLRPDTGFGDILRATFPCGSVTGAPKRRTLELIQALETRPRGLYCGTLGWVDPPRAAGQLGAFCLSVGIRTLILEAPDGRAELGVGAGIVLGSEAQAEHAEVLQKAAFVLTMDPGFSLFETFWAQGGGAPRLAAHLARLGASARALGFPWAPEAAVAAVQAELAKLDPAEPHRLRLDLAKDGTFTLRAAPLGPMPGLVPGGGAVGVGVAPEPVHPHPLLARHKTSWRPHYDEGLRRAEAQGWFDQLFLDPQGRLVEGARSSIFLRLGGRWITPPVGDGALPGIWRAQVLGDPAWDAAEGTLWARDLAQAEAVMVGNALRGAWIARIAGSLPPWAL